MGGHVWRKSALGGLWILGSQLAGALPAFAQQESLPSPLTLEQALAFADAAHPDRQIADASLAQAEARSRQVEATDDFQLGFTASLRAVDPSKTAIYQTHDDSLARLNLSKQLYDFGRTARAEEAAAATLSSREWQLREVRLQRRLDVMQRFFAVLLADLEYARDNEALSTAYISFDRALNKQELGRVSDIDLLELESLYQQSRLQMNVSRNKQRITRSQLAISLNRPLDLPRHLVAPDWEVEAPSEELEVWIGRVLQENPRLRSLRAEVDAAVKQLQASEAEDNPVLRGELEAASYQRELGGRDPFTAALVFEMPLYSGRRVDAKAAEQRALLQQKQAELAAYELALHQQVLDIWMAFDQLRLQAEALLVTADYRDLYLDRSRTLYDLDMQTDLGDSMSQIADIQWRKAQNRFDSLLLLARLKALAGESLMEGAPQVP